MFLHGNLHLDITEECESVYKINLRDFEIFQISLKMWGGKK